MSDCDKLEQTRISLGQERTPAYGDALALARKLEAQRNTLQKELDVAFKTLKLAETLCNQYLTERNTLRALLQDSAKAIRSYSGACEAAHKTLLGHIDAALKEGK